MHVVQRDPNLSPRALVGIILLLLVSVNSYQSINLAMARCEVHSGCCHGAWRWLPRTSAAPATRVAVAATARDAHIGGSRNPRRAWRWLPRPVTAKLHQRNCTNARPVREYARVRKTILRLAQPSPLSTAEVRHELH